MKKIIYMLVFSIILSCSVGVSVNAATVTTNNTTNEDIDLIYKNAFDNAEHIIIDNIDNDDMAYAFLKKNNEVVCHLDNGTIELNSDAVNSSYGLNPTEVDYIVGFVNRLNKLVELDAIQVNDDLYISSVTNPLSENTGVMPRATAISIMDTTRAHANTLKQVYDNAVIGTKNATAGKYFAERVKSGGVWDYKVSLGVTTVYYVEDLRTTMTGEAIGNFHYGYVGRAVFSATTLKSAAGMYQIYSGTSSIKYWDTFFDEPKDSIQIQNGIDKYEAEH